MFSPIRKRNIGEKKSHNFGRLPLSSILYIDLIEFSENQDKEFQHWDRYRLLHIFLTVYTLEEVIRQQQSFRGISKFLLENAS